MSANTDSHEAEILALIPDGAEVALFTTPTDDGGGGTEVPAAGGTNYARQTVTWSTVGPGTPATKSEKSNTNVITFPTPNIGITYIVTHVAIFVAGDMKRHGPLVDSKTVDDSNPFVFNVGELKIQED